MPELAEVEIARRHLLRWAMGRRFVAVELERSPLLKRQSPAAFARELAGARLVGAERRGKNVVALLRRGREERGWRFHLGMTGKLSHRKKGEAPPRFSRARFVLDDGWVIHFCDLRLFGALEAGDPDEMRARAFSHLGPDPFVDGLDGATLAARVGRSAKPVKVALMDQEKLAGIGNILASESCWRAKLSPFRPAKRVTAAEWKRLAAGIHAAIAHALADQDVEEVVYVEEDPSVNPFRVYERANAPCPRCRTPIRRAVQGGRSTYWCPSCQPGPSRGPR